MVSLALKKDVPQSGYKQTELGLIPEDWDVVAIETQFDITAGGDLVKEDYSPHFSPPFEFPIYSNALTDKGLYGYSKSYRYEKEKITVTARGGVGHAEYRNSNFFPIGRLLVLSPKKSCDLRFITEYINNFVEFALESTGVPQLTAPQISKYVVALPSIVDEQKAIAEALSDADGLIEALSELIAKKRQIKQGAMQDLLTGKKRLAGFGGDWVSFPIGSIAPMQRGFDLPNSKLQVGIYPVVYSNGIMNYHQNYMVKSPGVVTGRSGTIGKIHFIETDFWPHNTSLWVTRFNGNNPKFIYYLYDFIGFERFSSGSGVPTLNRNDAHSFYLKLPSNPKEQEAISQILTDMDSEISTLEIKLEKAKQIKQGMMQDLLTGKVRLI